MNDYLNRRWQNFMDDGSSIKREVLKEGRTKKGGVVKAKTQKRVIPIPIPSISEAWGKPGNADRAQAEVLLNRVATDATWQAKIKNLNDFVNGCKGEGESACLSQADSTMLSKLMALDILAAIVYDFSASVSGFLFEVFIATLVGGSAEQIQATQKRKEGEAGDIADITVIDGKPLSLKFFRKGGSKEIEGSLADLRASVAKYKEPITYLVALKEGTSENVSKINFYEFTIGSSAVVGSGGRYVYAPKRAGKGKFGGYIDVDGPESKSLQKGTKFSIPVSILAGTSRKYKAWNWEKGKSTATLDFGTRDELLQVAENYAKQISTDIVKVYDRLDVLTTKINDYLINSNMNAGGEAVSAAFSATHYTRKLADKKESPGE